MAATLVPKVITSTSVVFAVDRLVPVVATFKVIVSLPPLSSNVPDTVVREPVLIVTVPPLPVPSRVTFWASAASVIDCVPAASL